MEHGRDAAAGPAGAPSAGASQAAGPGGGGGGGGGSGAPPGPAPPIFVSWEEKRELSDRKPPRKSSGHTYTVKFFLCDLHGTEYLAATGRRRGPAWAALWGWRGCGPAWWTWAWTAVHRARRACGAEPQPRHSLPSLPSRPGPACLLCNKQAQC